MATRVFLLLACLVVNASCGQNSLTFVIDDTSSMYNEIRQVKDAAKAIVDIVLNEKRSQIEDIVLVTFNDPGTVLRKRTNDSQELKAALESIVVKGGGDCREESLSGIKKGLEESRKGSYVFVFTDASSKDYSKLKEVTTLCQETQSQIVFVLTGDCNDRSQESYLVYNKLARASNGQVFNINKDEVQQVLEYVKETIKGDRAVITSDVVPAYTWKNIQFIIDEQTEYGIVSAAGTAVLLKILNPRNYLMGETQFKKLTWTHNVKVVKLTDVTPGTYTARVHGNSEVNIMIFGRTDFTFQHGFSTEVKTSLTTTDTQPTTGVETYLMVSLQDKKNTGVVQRVELLNMRDQVVMTLPLTHITGDVYSTDKFLSPQETFKIVVVATSKNTGATVKREAKTPVTPIQSVRPVIDKSENIVKVKERASANLHCRITQGKPWPQVSWQVKKEHDVSFTSLRQTDNVITVTNALTNDYYKCVAANLAGNDEHILQLDVQVMPSFRNPYHTVETKIEGESVTIDCTLGRGNPRPTIIWQFKARDSPSYQTLSHKGEELLIGSTRLSDSGHYLCTAKSDEGINRKSTELVVKAKPTLEKLKPEQSAIENATVDLRCRVTKGFPAPTVNWLYKAPKSTEYLIVSKNERLHIVNVQLTNAGQYKCLAQNEVGTDEQVVKFVVNAPPRIISPAEYSGLVGDIGMRLPCAAVGHPAPAVSWLVDDRVVGTDKSKQMYVEENALFLLHPKEADSTNKSHSYVCQAKNDFGQAVQEYIVDISMRPVIDKSENIVKVKERASANLHCRITQGKPWPQVSWQVKKEHDVSFTSLRQTDNVITVTNALTNDYYKCVAANLAGNDEHILQLDVQVMPSFRNPYHTVETKIEGESVTIDCTLGRGNPRPTIIWQFKARDSPSYQTLSHKGEELLIGSTRLSDSGHYLCTAKSDEGINRKSTELVVKAKPTLEKLKPEQSAIENATVDLRCRVTKGFPAPTVNWLYKAPKSTEYLIVSKNERLHIVNVQLTNAGQYKCLAQNEVGTDEQVVKFVVNAPPRIISPAKYSGLVGDIGMRLPCAAVGHPAPAVSWLVDDRVVGTDKSKQMYVEENALFLLHPTEADSTNKSHSYVCQAKNDFGQAVQEYIVDISKYAEYEKPAATQYGTIGNPYDVLCPLPFKDPDSVRWFKYSQFLNLTGPTLHLKDVSDKDSANYTCRVSDMASAVSWTIELIIGKPPKQHKTFVTKFWNGEGLDEMGCFSQEVPVGKYEWYYNGQLIETARTEALKPRGWGEYTCRVSNPLGSLVLKWNVTSLNQDCGISKSLSKADKLPLILDSSLSWPALLTTEQYFVVPHSEKLQLYCHDDDSPDSPTKNLNKFPTFKSVYAICHKEDYFLIDGVSQKISDRLCKNRVTPSVMSTGQPCLGENTELKRVGFNVNGFTDVYESCVDKIKNVPLYTKMTTTPVGKKKSIESGDSLKHSCSDECCYEKIQLVNAADVSFGPAQKATEIDSLNSVNYCKPKNNTNWQAIEDLGKEAIKLTVWSGAAEYIKVGTSWTPNYLWKVLKEVDSSEKVAIVHENREPASAPRCAGLCGEGLDWIEPAGARTYCCSLPDFKKAFGLNINFDEN